MATESLVQLLPINTTRASLAMDGPASASFDTVIEAQSAYRGAAGNAITLALAADTEASALVAVETAGTNPLYQLVVSDDDFTATSLTGSGATSSSAPSLTSKAAYRDRPFYADEALALVWSEAGSGTMDATVTLWGWEEETARGHLIGTLNEGDAIPEAADDQISYSEMVVGVGGFSAFYAQIASPGGTATEIAVALKFCRLGERS
jgi:hypothetical protein